MISSTLLDLKLHPSKALGPMLCNAGNGWFANQIFPGKPEKARGLISISTGKASLQNRGKEADKAGIQVGRQQAAGRQTDDE